MEYFVFKEALLLRVFELFHRCDHISTKAFNVTCFVFLVEGSRDWSSTCFFEELLGAVFAVLLWRVLVRRDIVNTSWSLRLSDELGQLLLETWSSGMSLASQTLEALQMVGTSQRLWLRMFTLRRSGVLVLGGSPRFRVD